MRGTPVSYLDYSGGRNVKSAPYLLSEKECRDALNVHTSLSGDIEKRTGFVTLSGSTLTGSPINGTEVHTLFPVNVATKSLIGVARTASTDTIFKMTTGGVASALKTGLTANTRWYFAQGSPTTAGPIFGMNGVDKPIKWNGEAASVEEWVATTGTIPTAGKYLTYWSSRLWCAEGARLRFSGITGETSDPLNWESTAYVDLDPNDGQPITAINIVGDYLIVFKARKTYAIYDAASAVNRMISSNIGCVAHRSVVNTPDGLLFLSEDQGICKTNGSSITPISEQILPDLEQVGASPTTAALAAGTLEGRRYYLSVSFGGTRNDHTIEYDLIQNSWWLHSCASNQYALLDPSGTPVLYSADSTASARVSKAFVSGTFTDNGANYETFWTGPWYAWGVGGGGLDPHVVKRIREIRTDGVGNWEAFLASDFSETPERIEGEIWEQNQIATGLFGGEGTFGGTGTFGANPSATLARHYLTPGLGRSHSLKYVNNDQYNFKIYSTTFGLTARSN